MSATWPKVKLAEVLSERGETPSIEDMAVGKVRIVAKIGFNDGRIEFRPDGETKTGMILVRPGDLLISGINAAKGAIAIYAEQNEEPVAATIHYSAYEIIKERGDINYLWWFLRSAAFREILVQAVPGGIKTELRANRFLPIGIPLPPLAQQRRIVARIEALAAQIAEARSLRLQAAQEALALRTRAFDMFLSEPSVRREVLAGLLAEPLMNGLSVPASTLGRGVCFAKVGAVNTGVFNPLETKRADVALGHNSPYWLRTGDVLVSRGNTPDLVGRAAVYMGIPPRCAMPDLLIRLRVRTDDIAPRFLAGFFHSTEAREYIRCQIGGTSSTMPKISQAKLKGLRVPLPPLAVQRRIVAYVDGLQAQVDALKRLQADTAAELDALLPSILDRAFKGEL